MKTNVHFWSLFARLFVEWEIFQTKFVEEIKMYVFCSVTFSFESRAVYEIMEKNIVERGRP